MSKLSIIKIATSYIMYLSRQCGYDYTADKSEPSIEECYKNLMNLINYESKLNGGGSSPASTENSTSPSKKNDWKILILSIYLFLYYWFNCTHFLRILLFLMFWVTFLCPSVELSWVSTYRISANSFHGNYSFLNLTLYSVTFDHSTYRCGIYSRVETIRGNTVC